MIRFALGPSLGPVYATRPTPPAADSPGDGAPDTAAAKTLPEVSAASTACHPDGDSFCVGVAAKVHAHAAATSLRIVGLSAHFAPPGRELPADADAIAASDLPSGEVAVDATPGPDGIVAEQSFALDVLGLGEGKNDGIIVIAYDDEGYLPTTVEVPTIP